MQERSFGTHSGRFHADEVTACALLLLFGLIDEDKIVRTRDYTALERCEFVCDVGGKYNPNKKLFDHHQQDYQGMLSSAGMVLEYLYGEKKISKELFHYLKEDLINGVDDHDNGRNWVLGITTFSHIVAHLNPLDYEAPEAQENAAFLEAVHFVLGYLKRIIARFEMEQGCFDAVKQEMAKERKYLFFENALPWQEAFFALGGEKHPAQFVVMPMRGQWKLRGIPPDLHHRMEVRKPFPEEWAGLLDEDLQKVTGIKEALFCHKGRFISVWQTKEGALKALEKVLKAPNNFEQSEIMR